MNRLLLKVPCVVLLVLACGLAGCTTTDTAHTGNVASVVITGYTEEQIEQATIEVFGGDGYARVSGLIFEKQATKWDAAKYGGLGATSVWIKIRVSLTSRAEGSKALGCDVYVVENRGEGVMESERQLTFAKGDECKKILDKIKQRLAMSPPKPS